MAKKQKKHKTNAMRILEQKKISYKEYEFPWSETHLGTDSVSALIGVNEDRIFKTLVAVGNKTGPIVAVIPGNKELDLKKLAKASHNKKVEMLLLRNLEETTGYIRGGCSPIGMKKLFPTYFAVEAGMYSEIIVSAGQRGLQFELSPRDIIEVTNAEVSDITLLSET
ncbi:Cys-tRNA(Pro) deacylase [Enterococcus sp. BWT-B8]|uniref:Cys-tRNA(Pro) deacylase n=1 Tax=unclassified Enterococcus TaxID=2608891 RepID=UPI001E3B5B77|nr:MULTISPECIES: Cys-tRNA(Pro) deacylase [unclassified Enterococcus]MCB5950841.1 Cys-tRNA(Pro) deacylase [Enterococcus sp. BWT-B8]MCB5955281.1 Cys-tRNA(Pro) deacylase [Enterococcus sp. CWB-B31]